MTTIRQLALLLALFCPLTAIGAVPVTVAPLSSVLVELELRAPATVVPANEAVISAQVSAVITEVLADVGASVSKGDLLIRLDEADARLALSQAQAQLRALDAQIEQAELRLKRGEELIASNFISDDELLDRRTTVNVLRANRQAQLPALRSAELSLARTRIKAPFDAAVVARSAQVGSLAQPGTPMITLVQTSERELDAELDPRYAADLSAASNLRFESQGRRYAAELVRLSPVIETATRTQRGRFLFTEQTAAVGASGEIVRQDAAGLIPIPYIVQRGAQLGVFVADNSTARFVALPMAQEGRPARSDLPSDAQLVIRGQARLQDGDELSISRQ